MIIGYKIEDGELLAYDESMADFVLDLHPANDPLIAAALAAKAEAAKPQEVTMRQARLALREAGLLQAVEAAIAGMPGNAGADARIEWEYSSALKRSQPLVSAMAGAQNISPAQMDALFLAASLK